MDKTLTASLLIAILMRGMAFPEAPAVPAGIPAPVFYFWADRWDGGNPLQDIAGNLTCSHIAVLKSETQYGKMASFDGVAASGGSRFECGMSTALQATLDGGITIAIDGRMTSESVRGNNGGVFMVSQNGGSERFGITFNTDGGGPTLCMTTWNTACNARKNRCGTKEFFSTNRSTGILTNQRFFYIGTISSNPVSGAVDLLADLDGVFDSDSGAPADACLRCNTPTMTIIDHYGGSGAGGYSAQPGPAMDIRSAIVWDVALTTAQRREVWRTMYNGGQVQ